MTQEKNIEERPMMSDEEIKFFKSYLNKSKIVLEWGAGRSTLEFSKDTKKYYSIEHDFNWYNLIWKEILKNTKIYYVPPNTPNLDWHPVFAEGGHDEFRNYIQFANNIASFNKKFDIVLIDGRARVDCAIEVLPHLKGGSIVFIHDFNRITYWNVLKYYHIIGIAGKLVALKQGKSIEDKNLLIKRFLLDSIGA